MRAGVISALILLWVLGLGGAFVLAASEPAVSHPLATKGTPATTGAASPGDTETSPSDTEADGEGGTDIVPTGPPKARLRVGLKDFRLSPKAFVGKAGTITFQLVNEGRYTHDFRVEGEGVDVKAPKVGQGRERTWTATVEAGTYRISCPISNHSKRGMTGTLVVK